ncbi:IF44L protein, partial [Polypterus senegalus]
MRVGNYRADGGTAAQHVEEHLNRPARHNSAPTPAVQFLVSLRCDATGGFQLTVGDERGCRGQSNIQDLSMATSCPQLDRQTEKQLCMFFNGNVKFSLLYQGSCHGFNFTEIQHKCTNQGQIIMVGYLEDGLVLGGCMSKGLINQNTTLKDETAFHFSASQSEPVKTVHFEHNAVRFDSDLRFFQSNVRNNTVSVTSSQLEGEKILEELEVYRVEGKKMSSTIRLETCKKENENQKLFSYFSHFFLSPRKRNLLKESVVSYKPPTDAVSQARVLLVGPVGAGKSSFISSVCSVFHGRVSIQAMVGTAARSFTTKFRSYTIKAARGGEATPLVLCDMMGLGENDLSGVKVKDVLQVIKGHVPEGYKLTHSSNSGEKKRKANHRKLKMRSQRYTVLILKEGVNES